MTNSIRINRFIAMAGVASRRKAEQLIERGEITINGRTATLGESINPSRDEVCHRGKILRPVENRVYYLLHKPEGYLSSVSDDRGRKTVIDLVPSGTKVFPVGRLDLDVSGVLLLTNDGELSNKLIHPRYGVKKEYRALVRGIFTDGNAQTLTKEGIILDEKRCRAVEASLVSKNDNGTSLVRIVMSEGIKREVKRLLRSVGNPVLTLKRTEFAGLSLKNLKKGSYRELSSEEVISLRKLVK